MAEAGAVQPEPWLRGTLTEVDGVRRQVLHALEQAAEDAERWCAPLTGAELNARPAGLAPVAFHLRHIGRSLDRLLTYAEGRQLDEAQMALLGGEFVSDARREEILRDFRVGLEDAMRRIRAFDPATYEEARGVGRKHLPTTVGGLLVHCAEHTQRHVGQVILTAKVVRAQAG